MITDEIMDPKIDFSFKELFGHDETNFINFANAILKTKEDKKIVKATFLNSESSKDHHDNRGVRLDVFHDFEAHFIEIPKLQTTCYDATDSLEKWVLFLKQPEKETLEMLASYSQEIGQAYEKLEILSHDPKNRLIYEAQKKQLLDLHTQLDTAREEGIEKGVEIGMEKGMEKGREEAKLAMARKLKKLGVPIRTIMEASGVSEKEIEKL